MVIFTGMIYIEKLAKWVSVFVFLSECVSVFVSKWVSDSFYLNMNFALLSFWVANLSMTLVLNSGMSVSGFSPCAFRRSCAMVFLRNIFILFKAERHLWFCCCHQCGDENLKKTCDLTKCVLEVVFLENLNESQCNSASLELFIS